MNMAHWGASLRSPNTSLAAGAQEARAPTTGLSTIDRVVVIDDYSVARGGATALAIRAAQLLADAGLRVTYICGDKGDEGALAASGIELVALGGADLLNADRVTAVLNGVHNRPAAAAISAWIAKNDSPATLYHVHGWSKILSPSVFEALSPVASRCLVHAHDFFSACPNGAFYDYTRQETCTRTPLGFDCLKTACDKRSYTHKIWRSVRGANLFLQLRRRQAFGRLVMLHDKMTGYFERSGYDADRLVTIRNPAAPYTRERVRAEDNSEFFFIGRLDPEKGVADAVAAAGRAGVRLCIIGDGPLRAELEKAGDHVRFLGWRSHAEIADAIKSARAVIMPSRYPEPFGLVAVEAAASGVPVILPASAFLAEEMTELGFALSFDGANQQSMVSALQALDRMPSEDVRVMSEQAFASAPSLFNRPEDWRDALVAAYAAMLSPAAAEVVRSKGFTEQSPI
ncbi:glycosyltransferase family 4 protein [Rhizobium sp. AAP43]|uniref:glycosyltransferase family 4 protein n=1 Tax=Rhizobium sp. AAP43 TaxID=1523420 RepID=UPI000ACF4D9C|nr:glycosyltransferase [Rhizobium sp. AAP43]